MSTPLLDEMIAVADVQSKIKEEEARELLTQNIHVTGEFIEALNKFKISNNITASRGVMLWKLLNFAQRNADSFLAEHFQGLHHLYEQRAKENRKEAAKVKEKIVLREMRKCLCGKVFEVVPKKREKFCGRDCPERYSPKNLK